MPQATGASPSALPLAPPLTPVDEEEVEDTVTPRRIRVQAGPSDDSTGPRRSTRNSKPSDYHRRIAAGEGTVEGNFAD